MATSSSSAEHQQQHSNDDCLQDLLRPLKSCKSREEQQSALDRIEEYLLSTEAIHGEQVAAFLLREVVVVSVDHQQIFRVLTACGDTASLSAAIGTIRLLASPSRKCSSPNALSLSLTVVRKLLLSKHRGADDDKEQRHGSCCCWIDGILRPDDAISNSGNDLSTLSLYLDPWVDLVLRIPVMIANACHANREPLPAWAVQSTFASRLLECAYSVYQKHPETSGRLYLQTLIQRAIRRGSRDDVARGLFQCYQDVHKQHSTEDAVGRILEPMRGTKLTLREISLLCHAILLHGMALDRTNNSLHSWTRLACVNLLSSTTTTSDILDCFVNQTILSQNAVLSEKEDTFFCQSVALLIHQTPIVVELEERDSETDDDDHEQESSTLHRQVRRVAESWSQFSFVQQVDARSQHHISTFLIAALGLLENVDPLMSFVPTLLQGVTERLHTTVSSNTVRKDGMRVAQKLAQCLGQEVHFDELKDDDNHKEEGSTEPVEPDKSPIMMRRSRRVQRRRNMDPDVEINSDDEQSQSESSQASSRFDDDSVWDEDSKLEMYALDDDEEDLRETPRPLYLRQCLDLLESPEAEEAAPSRHEAALEALPDLVRSRPADLQDVGRFIALHLLHMENKFSLDNFDERLMESLYALAAEEPASVGLALIEDIFNQSSLAVKLRSLCALKQTAFELSGNKTLLERMQSPKGYAPLENTRIFGKSSLVSLPSGEGTLESKTRRWGRGRQKVEPVSVSNRLISVAPSWFYSMVGLFLQHKEDPVLWSGHIGSTLLANFFSTLVSLVGNCGASPGTEILAKDLFELVWNFRDAEVSEIRLAVLDAVGTSFSLIREEALFAILMNESSFGVAAYLREASNSETDEQCRHAAQQVLGLVAATAKAIEY